METSIDIIRSSEECPKCGSLLSESLKRMPVSQQQQDNSNSTTVASLWPWAQKKIIIFCCVVRRLDGFYFVLEDDRPKIICIASNIPEPAFKFHGVRESQVRPAEELNCCRYSSMASIAS